MTRLISDEEATGQVKDIFEEIKKNFGMVPNFFRAQAVDPEWLSLNWEREKAIMIKDGSLDRKTKELLAMTISLVNNCNYCAPAHEAMAKQCGATDAELLEAKKVIELFSSFNAIADSLRVPCDITP